MQRIKQKLIRRSTRRDEQKLNCWTGWIDSAWNWNVVEMELQNVNIEHFSIKI